MGQRPSRSFLFPTSTEPTRSRLKPGDHIYSNRAGILYYHHGIYIEDDMVIHLMGPGKKTNPSSPCQKCGYNQEGGIVKTCLDCFLNGNLLFIFEYGVSPSESLRRPGRCSILASRSDDEVVSVATEFLQGKNFGEYNFALNNCEDFASFCKTGIRSSSQRNAVMMPLVPLTVAPLMLGNVTSNAALLQNFPKN